MTKIITIVTVVYNNRKTIEDSIKSIISQSKGSKIQYILIDGLSTDGTLDIVNKYRGFIDVFISEKDNGIYDAMNKGLKYSTGDIIGFLNSDDIFFDNKVLTKIVSCFSNEIDCVFGDVLIVDELKTNSVIRNYSSRNFSVSQFQYGHMPDRKSVV